MPPNGTFRLKIAGHIAEYAPGGQGEIDLPADGRDLRSALAGMGFNPDLVRSALVGGKRVALSYVPEADDEVILLAPAAGG